MNTVDDMIVILFKYNTPEIRVRKSILIRLFVFCCFVLLSQTGIAQKLVTTKGRVLNSQGAPIALSIFEKGNTINYSLADKNGYFSIQTQPYAKLIFGDSSCNRQELSTDTNKFLHVVMEDEGLNYDTAGGIFRPKNLIDHTLMNKNAQGYSESFILNGMFFNCKKQQIGRSTVFPIGLATATGFVSMEIDYTKTKILIVGKRSILINKLADTKILSRLLHDKEFVENTAHSAITDSIITYLHGSKVVLKNVAPKIYKYNYTLYYKDAVEGLFSFPHSANLQYITEGVYADKDVIHILTPQTTTKFPIDLNDVCVVDYIKYDEIDNNKNEDIYNNGFLQALKKKYSSNADVDLNNLQPIRNSVGESTRYSYDRHNLFYEDKLVASNIDINTIKALHPQCLTDGPTHYIAGEIIRKEDLFVEIDWVW